MIWQPRVLEKGGNMTYRGRDIVVDTMAEMMAGNVKFCLGCKRGEACRQDKDQCISQHLFVWAVGWSDDPTVMDRIEGRPVQLAKEA